MKDKTRIRLWTAQNGRCCYCGREMAFQHTTRAQEAERLGISMRSVPNRRVTIEHLRRKADGGTNRRDNLALACKQCNTSRGEIDWLTYKSIRMGEREKA